MRPLAAGTVPVGMALAIAAGLLLAGFTIALRLPSVFAWITLAYAATSIAYSLFLKSKVVADVLVLAALYSLRIIAGGAAVGVELSAWLIAFSMFIFLSLAFLKRYSEFGWVETADTGAGALPGRGYVAPDRLIIALFGAGSGLIAVLVLALYINSSAVVELYSKPQLLWLTCPVLLYWIVRAWLLAGRRTLHEDPLIFALKDPASYAAGLATLAIGALAI